jgi:tetratricopeptide (TPR) repeat protein
MLPTAEDVQPCYIGMDEVAHFEEMIGFFCKLVSQTGSHMRKAAIGQVHALGELIEETSTGPLKTRLLEVAAQMTQLAGCMSYDCRMYKVAQRYYLLGLRFCQEAGNHLIPSKLIGELSYIATAMGNHQEFLELINFALYSLPIQQQGLVRAELLARRASALALLGKSSDARRAIEASLEMSAGTKNEPLPPVFDYLSLGEIHGLAATTYLDLARHAGRSDSISGYTAQAEKEIIAALEGRERSLARSRAVDTIRLMNTRLLQNEPSEAVNLGNTVLELARGVRSSRVADRLVQFQRELRDHHPRFPKNAEFHDRLRAHLVHSGEKEAPFVV